MSSIFQIYTVKYNRHKNPANDAKTVSASSLIDFPLNKKNPVVEMYPSAVKNKTNRFFELNNDHLDSIDCDGTIPNVWIFF